MSKATKIIVGITTFMASCLVAYQNMSPRVCQMNENIEALTDQEVNIDKLKKMYMQQIWEVRLVYDAEAHITDVFCVTGGEFICPLN